MKTYYIVKEMSGVGEWKWEAYCGKWNFFWHDEMYYCTSFRSAEDCIVKLDKYLNSKEHKRIIVEIVRR